jgi:lactoylglutathione lyase
MNNQGEKMHLGSIYLIVKEFDKTIRFYEQLLEIPVTSRNMDRFAQFIFDQQNISIMNGYFDTEYSDQVIRKGDYDRVLDDKKMIADATNTNKFVLNFWTEDLRKEHQRIIAADFVDVVTSVKYINAGQPYYYFQVMDPDDNVIEITGNYSPDKGELE